MVKVTSRAKRERERARVIQELDHLRARNERVQELVDQCLDIVTPVPALVLPAVPSRKFVPFSAHALPEFRRQLRDINVAQEAVLEGYAARLQLRTILRDRVLHLQTELGNLDNPDAEAIDSALETARKLVWNTPCDVGHAQIFVNHCAQIVRQYLDRGQASPSARPEHSQEQHHSPQSLIN